MKIAEIISPLESLAPLAYQENYDNAGLITGHGQWDCSGVLLTLDATEPVIAEAIAKGYNLIIAHHPIIFGGLKKITGKNYVEKAVIAAIKNDIALYALHTNLDNVLSGVNGRIADRLGLIDRQVLAPKSSTLKKMYSFVPLDHAEEVRNALFHAGAGWIGNYSEASFNAEGMGTYKAGPGANPFAGKMGERHAEKEIKIEVIFPGHLQAQVLEALLEAHPYEEVAYDLVDLANPGKAVGSGLVGRLPASMEEEDFLAFVKDRFQLSLIRHTRLNKRPVQKIALCGGAGSFLIFNALDAGADFFISSDFKYHEFFDANDRLVLADIGHFESEQFTIDLFYDILREKFPNFAVLKSGTKTNPVHYYF
jgi:dinuclear metal center YbgI/SA1388 family protein